MWVVVNALAAAAAPVEIGSGPVAADGQVDHPMVRGTGVKTGVHEVLLHVADFYRQRGLLQPQDAAFLDVAAFRFTVCNLDEHYHLPFKVSPWGLSIWRGR
jgi:5-hydroxyisourate hydrolase